MRKIDKLVVGEYPEYSKIYLDLLEDDGKILEHLWQNFLTIKEFIYNYPKKNCYTDMMKANGQSKKFWFITLMMSGFFHIGL